MTKTELYTTAQAATNLYGIISLLDLRTLINHYFPQEKMTVTTLEEEIPHIIPLDMHFCLNNGLLLLATFLLNEKTLKDMVQKQSGKKLYLPLKKEEFYRYESVKYYRPTLEYNAVRDFFLEVNPDTQVLEELLCKIRIEQQFSYPMETTFRSIVDHNFLPPEKDKQDHMIDLLIAMDATARKFEHKGKSLWEMERVEGNSSGFS